MSNRNFFKSEKNKNRPTRAQRKYGFVAPKKVEDHWDFYQKSVYVAKPGRGIPAWLLPLIILLVVIGVVFWLAPTVIKGIRSLLSAGEDQTQNEVSLLYGDDTWTVCKPVADVFDNDDIKAARTTQTLYNEPVLILSEDCTYGFVQVRLGDGCEGYMQRKDLIDNRSSIEPDLYSYKLVIADKTKRILSHASQGTLLAEVPMGTILFADYRGDGISRVGLPDGSFGWISDDGVIILPPTGKIEPVSDGVRYFCSTALAFNQVTILDNGQSVYGISIPGIARLAGMINGINLPRAIGDLAASGQPVELVKDAKTGIFDLSAIEPGDLIFLTDQVGMSDTPVDMAICIKKDQILFARPGQSAIRLIDLTRATDLQLRILFVRRLY